MIKIKFLITGEKPDVENILKYFNVRGYKINYKDEDMFLTVFLRKKDQIKELIRRLKAKKNRPTTTVSIVENSLNANSEQLKFQNVGWLSKLLKKNTSLYVSISRIVVVGNNLMPGTPLYSYLVEDENSRSIMMTYLDGHPRNISSEINVIDSNVFLEKANSRLTPS